jgi:hypothetical protein
MKTPVEILLTVAAIGGRLEPDGDKLWMHLPADGPPGLKVAIRQHKTDLLELLRLDFWVVRSDTVNAMLFWVPDQTTVDCLAAAGADLGSIYTASELEQLVRRRVTVEELPLIHAANQRFNGKLTEP